jgi:hypothetical protein
MAAETTTPPKGGHRWRFFRAGGVDQVRIERGADIVNLDQLDQKLWVALSCPVKGLEFDERTLHLLDTATDGHVRPPEILAAAKWVGRMLKNPDDLVAEKDSLPLASINNAHLDGKKLLSSARMILENLGKADATEITVDDTARTAEFFKNAKLNGDGVVPPEAMTDADAAAAAKDVLATVGGEPDRSGKQGVSAAKVEAFFKEAEAYAAWWKKADDAKAATLPLGDGTAAACAAVGAVRAKVDDYFARCRLAEYDPRAQGMLNSEEKRYLEMAAKDLTITSAEIQCMPLQKVEAGRALDLCAGLNPAWAAAVETLRVAAVQPILGKDKKTLTEAEWAAIGEKLAGYAAWQASKAGTVVEPLGLKRVRELLAGKAKEALLKQCADDAAVQPEIDAITEVERLVRYHRDLRKLLVNYVSFSDFYSRARPAIFQAGTLYLDGRSCELCFRVDGGHGALAAMSSSYLAYCDLTRLGQKMTVACAFTAGDSDHLLVGRNGIFYDRKGNDWDATITRIVDHPISIGQAFWAPYKRFLRWIEEQVAKRAAAADAEATNKLTDVGETLGEAAKTGEAKAPKGKFDIGIVAALGVAVGGIATAVSGAMNAFFGLGLWMPLGFLGIILAISGPAMAIAWLKLRQRNLGPILDSNGWAVNGRVKVNIPLGGSLTDLAKLPPGSERSLVDPFQRAKKKWPKVVGWILVFVLALFGVWQSRMLDDQTKFPWYAKALHSVPLVKLETRTERNDRLAAESERQEIEEAAKRLRIESAAKQSMPPAAPEKGK